MNATCEQIQMKLLDGQGGKLDQTEQMHLESCSECAKVREDVLSSGREIERTASVLGRADSSNIRPEWKEHVRARMKTALASKSTAPNSAREVALSKQRRLWEWLAWPAGSRRWIAGAAAAAFVLAVAVWGFSFWRQQRPIGRLEFADGSVEVKAAGKSIRHEGIGQVACRRGTVLGAAGNANGIFSIGESVRGAFAPSTELAFETENRIRINHGTAWFRVLPGGKGFAVDTAHGTVRVTGTSFGVTVDANSVQVEVTEGTVELERNGTAASVAAGQTIVAAQEQPAQAHERKGGEELPQWVKALLAREKAAHAEQFVPSVLIE